MMALSLAACGGSSTTTTATTTTTTTTTTTADATDAVRLTGGEDTLTGTSADDTYNAGGLTFTSEDVIDGGAGSDTLNVVSAAAVTSFAAALTDVEVISVNQSAAHNAAYVFNAIGSAGITDVKSVSSTGDVTVNNIVNTVALTADGTAGTLGSSIAAVSVTVLNSVVSGATDEISLTATGGATAQFNATGVDTTAGYEVINLASSGATANAVEIGGTTAGLASTLKISGAADLTLAETAVADGGEINASQMTGALTTTLAAEVDSFTGGAGDDVITVTASELDGNVTSRSIDLGAGTNTLKIADEFTSLSASTADTVHTILNVDVIEQSAAEDVDASILAGAQHVKVEVATNGFGASAADEVTLGAGDSLTVTDGINATYGLLLDLDDVSGDADDAAVTLSDMDQGKITSAADIEEISIVSSGSADAGNTITVLDASNSATVDLDGAAALTLKALEIAQPTDGVGTIDASDMTGAFTLGGTSADFKSTNSDVFSVTLGTGTNNVYFGATATNDDVVIATAGSTDTVHITEKDASASTIAPTLSGVETLVVTAGATSSSGDTALSAENFTDVGEIDIQVVTNASAGTNTASEDFELTNIAAGQQINLLAGVETTASFSLETLVLKAATGVTNVDVTLEGSAGASYAASASGKAGPLAVTTDAGSLGLTDAMLDASGDFANQHVLVGGVTNNLTALTLSGGGETSVTGVNNAITIDHSGSAISLTSVDATGWNGDVNLSNLVSDEIATGASISLGGAGTKLTLNAADVARDAVTVTGGAGTDTIATSGITGTMRVASTGVEAYSVSLLETDTDGSLAASILEFRDTSGVVDLDLAIKADTNSTDAADIDETLQISNLANDATVSFGGADAHGTDYGIGSGDSTTIDAAITGATSINIDNVGAVGAVTIQDLNLGSTYTTVEVSGEVASKAFTVDAMTGTSLTGISVNNNTTASAGTLTVSAITATSTDTLSVDSTKGAVTLSNLGTMNSLETLTVNTGVAASGGKTTITAGTSTSVDTITASGTGAFEITDLTAASLDNINASGVTGAVTIGDANGGLTTAAGATITTGTGADVITMSTASSLTLTAGEHDTNDDNLILVGTMNSGAGVINLSSSDQVVTINGTADAAVQSQFEDVDVSAVTTTGSYGFGITAAAEGSVIVGSGANDTITGGAGVDNITGGAGNDTINLSVDGEADTLVFSASGSNGKDTVADFAVNEDILNLVAMTAGTGVEGTAVTAKGAAVTTASRKDFVQVISTAGDTSVDVTNSGSKDIALADLTAGTLTNVAAFLAEKYSGNSSSAGTDTGVYVINFTDTGSNETYVYQWDNDTSANVVQAGELSLAAIITRDAVLDNNDIIA